MRLPDWMSFQFPAFSSIRSCLVRPRFVFYPHRQSHFLSLLKRFLDQFLLGAVSGSMIMATPCFRFRVACPVSHQLRDFCQRYSHSCRITQIRSVLMVGNPSGAFRSALCKVVNDHVIVPSFSASGSRFGSASPRSHYFHCTLASILLRAY
jgi:hypothetical protein